MKWFLATSERLSNHPIFFELQEHVSTLQTPINIFWHGKIQNGSEHTCNKSCFVPYDWRSQWRHFRDITNLFICISSIVLVLISKSLFGPSQQKASWKVLFFPWLGWAAVVIRFNVERRNQKNITSKKWRRTWSSKLDSTKTIKNQQARWTSWVWRYNIMSKSMRWNHMPQFVGTWHLPPL